MQKNHKVLLLGSGLMTPALIDYLVSFKDTHITVASNILEDAKAVCSRHPQYLKPTFVDIFNASDLDKLVAEHDAVISFVPPTMHLPVFTSCLKQGKHLTTSSYISPDMEKLHEEAKKKGLIFLNEIGLDPGIDIMSTIKVRDEAAERGWKIVSYESYCGGLPVAEQAENPLGYKFSWNPGAAIKASKNKATYMKNGKITEAKEALKVVEDRDDISVSMKLEVYPNRDSVSFMKRFGMEDCETFIRGTIRFKGFCFIISNFHDKGFTSDDPVPSSVKTLRDLVESKLPKQAGSLHPKAHEAIKDSLDMLSKEDQDFTLKLFTNIDVSYLKTDEILPLFKQYYKALFFLGFYDDHTPLVITKDGKPRAYIDVFGDMLARKLSMNEDDRDLVIMRHNFVLEDKNKKRWNHYSTLIASGSSKKQGGYTIMAKTVGMTCAIGTRLILDNKISQRGVLSPITKEIYIPMMKELERFGVVMIEESERFRTVERAKL